MTGPNEMITDLNPITGANLADGDEFVVVDVSVPETKKITRAELIAGLPSTPLVIVDYDAANAASHTAGPPDFVAASLVEVPSNYGSLSITGGVTSGADTINGLNALTADGGTNTLALMGDGTTTFIGRSVAFGVYKFNSLTSGLTNVLVGDSAGTAAFLTAEAYWDGAAHVWALVAYNGATPMARVSTVTVDTNPHLVTLVFEGKDARLFLDNAELTLSAKPGAWDSVLAYGNVTATFQWWSDAGTGVANFDGLFGEGVLYVPLTDEQIMEAGADLMTKWGI